MQEGTVVLVGTGQAGSVWWEAGNDMAVLLRNLEIWTGPAKLCREPQTQEELDAAPIEVSRPEPKPKRKRHETD